MYISCSDLVNSSGKGKILKCTTFDNELFMGCTFEMPSTRYPDANVSEFFDCFCWNVEVEQEDNSLFT